MCFYFFIYFFILFNFFSQASYHYNCNKLPGFASTTRNLLVSLATGQIICLSVVFFFLFSKSGWVHSSTFLYICNIVFPQGGSLQSSTAKPLYRLGAGSETGVDPFRASSQASTIMAWRCSTWLRRGIPTLGSRAACGLWGIRPPLSHRSRVPQPIAQRRPHPSWRSPPPPRRQAGESSRLHRESLSR